jgi:hypothetical protein
MDRPERDRAVDGRTDDGSHTDTCPSDQTPPPGETSDEAAATAVAVSAMVDEGAPAGTAA